MRTGAALMNEAVIRVYPAGLTAPSHYSDNWLSLFQYSGGHGITSTAAKYAPVQCAFTGRFAYAMDGISGKIIGAISLIHV